MSKKKHKQEKPKEAGEPKEVYGSRTERDKTIRLFSSFDEAEEYGRQKMADITPQERLKNLEAMRKIFLRQYLLPDGTWPPLARVIKIQKPKV